MIGNVNTYLTNPGSNNPQKVIDYYSNSDFEYNIRVGDYCKVTLDSNLLYWISGIVVEIDEEEKELTRESVKEITMRQQSVCRNAWSTY